MSWITSMSYKDESGRWQIAEVEFNTEREAERFGFEQFILNKCVHWEVYHS